MLRKLTGNFTCETMKTFSAKAEEIDRKWHVIDAEGKVLGEVAVAAARLLRGKDKPLFTPHVDCGDNAVAAVRVITHVGRRRRQ